MEEWICGKNPGVGVSGSEKTTVDGESKSEDEICEDGSVVGDSEGKASEATGEPWDGGGRRGSDMGEFGDEITVAIGERIGSVDEENGTVGEGGRGEAGGEIDSGIGEAKGEMTGVDGAEGRGGLRGAIDSEINESGASKIVVDGVVR